ncbi:hypothetical protein FKM82_030808 [Ascaphus truei]
MWQCVAKASLQVTVIFQYDSHANMSSIFCDLCDIFPGWLFITQKNGVHSLSLAPDSLPFSLETRKGEAKGLFFTLYFTKCGRQERMRGEVHLPQADIDTLLSHKNVGHPLLDLLHHGLPVSRRPQCLLELRGDHRDLVHHVVYFRHPLLQGQLIGSLDGGKLISQPPMLLLNLVENALLLL